MLHKKQKILKNTLSLHEIEFARKSCRALNKIINIRKQNILYKDSLYKSINREFNNICLKHSDNADLLNSVLLFDEKKGKFRLYWK